jgi:glyoxylase-like metal-dependent hydrolase (beta-lactamase superfamily II)
MTGEAYSFKVGETQCAPLSDGSLPYPPNWFFANVPQQCLEEELRSHGLRTDEVAGTYTCLLVSTGKNKVLIDTGAGKMAPSTGELLVNLEKAGARPTEIDTVILTHGNPDHRFGTRPGCRDPPTASGPGCRRQDKGHGLSFPVSYVGAGGLAPHRRVAVGTGVLMISVFNGRLIDCLPHRP